ncbi:family 43 glycosylhydrolase [Flammeovirga yaeyamensis]|uniref:Family 43 glycosylhydrolase n=1 Tax=Flammeovirga yaeyamensis TaxID=367791 RepID=A0AAX1N4S7_9BACT|nr:family 43 glycosylhydrolase [Flammeovirga yaeyamensis]MBB3698250.1 beta-xylosidase [Flammeovirga yaeyamensis]NMF34395.1 family 43 glycosylhydrolase [Flammeovirga yaeyamensis]QWG01376.1 family 43 glycosylhydrolase [Flammeovirga yaeyamensis]
MKRIGLLILITLSISLNTIAQNPIIKHIYTADPTARVYDGKLYIYPSHDVPWNPEWEKLGAEKESNGHVMTDYHAFSTEDLVNFTDLGVIVAQENVPWGNKLGYGMWAPCIASKGGKYYYYFPNKPADKSGFRQIGLATAEKPEGPFTIEPNYIEGLKGIDPNAFIDDDGQAYMYWGGGKGNSLKVVKLSDDMKSIVGETVVIENLPQEYKEGPFVFKRKGMYYLTFPHNLDTQNSTEEIGYAISKHPLGPFEYKGTIMDRFEDCWTNHQSIVEYKDQWYMFYHHNDISKAGNLRSVSVDSLFFEEDGSIRKVIPTLRGVGITSAKDTIQIDRYSEIHNAEVDFVKRVGIPEWKITNTKKESWVQYNTVSFDDKPKNVQLKVKSKAKGGRIELRENVPNGKLIATVEVGNTNEDWINVDTKLNYRPKGIMNLVCVFKEVDEMELDWVLFSR